MLKPIDINKSLKPKKESRPVGVYSHLEILKPIKHKVLESSGTKLQGLYCLESFVEKPDKDIGSDQVTQPRESSILKGLLGWKIIKANPFLRKSQLKYWIESKGKDEIIDKSFYCGQCKGPMRNRQLIKVVGCNYKCYNCGFICQLKL